MMKFRTEINLPDYPFLLDPERPILLTGSCFADNMATQMRKGLWKAANPAGTLFNPLSIASALRLLILDNLPEERFQNTIFEHDGLFKSWTFDSKFCASDKKEVWNKFQNARVTSLETLQKGLQLIVTFGTSRCYFPEGENCVPVGNCHKQNPALFTIRRISVSEITATWIELLKELQEKFNGLKTIITVSPVRHYRDGMQENSRSKATLLLAAEEICAHVKDCIYFPAYELLIDDLRDYRFYADDLVHPSNAAVEYIWEKFSSSLLTAEGRALLKEGEKLRSRFEHRPIVADSPKAIDFRQATLQASDTFYTRHPSMLKLP